MKKNNLTPLQKKLQILDVFLCIAVLGLYGTNFIMQMNLEEGETLPYFNQHFLSPIGFILIGIIAYTLPYINKSSLGDPSGDKMMKIIVLLCIGMAIITCVFSYV